ncbi:unnamed protein product, partial [Timema podura]|nr:unnamed protein product [Timema podura]
MKALMLSSITKWPLLMVLCGRLNKKKQVDEVAPPLSSTLSRRCSTLVRDLVCGVTPCDRNNSNVFTQWVAQPRSVLVQEVPAARGFSFKVRMSGRVLHDEMVYLTLLG